MIFTSSINDWQKQKKADKIPDSSPTGWPMKDLAENNLIRFKNITKKQESIYANFKVNGIRAGVNFSASIAVDIAAAEVDPSDTLEKIIEECARIGVHEFKKAEFQFEGMCHV